MAPARRPGDDRVGALAQLTSRTHNVTFSIRTHRFADTWRPEQLPASADISELQLFQLGFRVEHKSASLVDLGADLAGRESAAVSP